MSADNARAYVRAHVDDYIAGIQALVRQPSISAQNVGITELAAMIQRQLEAIGANVTVTRVGSGNPIIYGCIDHGQPQTVLIYGHYDVQPPDPLDEWTHDPFGGEIDNGAIFGRGVADEKGELYSRLVAVEAILKTAEQLPVNVKFVFEGEEEVGSPSLEPFIREHAHLLTADAGIWEGGFKQRNGRINLAFGNRGICYVELRCKGLKQDLHSGRAGLVTQPTWRLLEALATMRDAGTGRVTIEGFYDEVKAPSPHELDLMTANPLDEEGYKRQLGVTRFNRGLTKTELLREHLYQPTFTICGINAGYIGPGMKTIVPREAMVKIDCRLVPDMHPHKTYERIVSHMEAHGFGDIQATLLAATPPGQTALDDRVVKVVADSAVKVYGVEPEIHPRFGGSTPLYLFNNLLGIPTVSGVGVRYYGCNFHAPDENIRIADFIEGTEHLVQILYDLAE